MHNLWPAQPDGQTFGWRRQQKHPPPGHQRRGTLDEIRDDLNRMADFVEVRYQQHIHGLVSSGRHLVDPPPEA